MKIVLLAITTFLLMGFVIFKKGNDNNPNFECRLSVNKTSFEPGEIPKLTVEIKNLTSKDVYLVGSLDGSEGKIRMPYCYYTIDKPRKDSVPVILRCGVVNPLKISDFVLVKPNETFNPYAKIGSAEFFSSSDIEQKENFMTPGVYRIQFHYSTKSTNTNDFRNDNATDKKKIQKLLKKVPKMELQSNVIEINIKARTASE